MKMSSSSGQIKRSIKPKAPLPPNASISSVPDCNGNLSSLADESLKDSKNVVFRSLHTSNLQLLPQEENQDQISETIMKSQRDKLKTSRPPGFQPSKPIGILSGKPPSGRLHQMQTPISSTPSDDTDLSSKPASHQINPPSSTVNSLPSSSKESKQSSKNSSTDDVRNNNNVTPESNSPVPVPTTTKSSKSHRKIKSNTKKEAKSSVSTIHPLQQCNLKNVLISAARCVAQLHQVREYMTNLVAKNEHLARGLCSNNPEAIDLQKLSTLAHNVANLSREAFVPAHRLNATAIALYNAEDFLRYPKDIRHFDISSSSTRIKLPGPEYNEVTVGKLRALVDHATLVYHQVDNSSPMGQNMTEILFLFMRAIQDYYVTAMGTFNVFNVLLYLNAKERQELQAHLLSMSSVDRSDLLVGVQELRRAMDEIVIVLEKLSWGSYVVSRLSIGKSLHVGPHEASVINLKTPNDKSLEKIGPKTVKSSNVSLSSRDSERRLKDSRYASEGKTTSKKSVSSSKKSTSSTGPGEKKSVKKVTTKKKKSSKSKEAPRKSD